jgi:hypothetical protein
LWAILQGEIPSKVHGDRIPRTNDFGKDGHTVKKLIALLLVVAFVCAGSIGCSPATTSGGGAKPSGSGAGSGK